MEAFTEATFRKSLVNFEKRQNENQRVRIKHAEEPGKFVESETELFASLDEMQGAAVQSELYNVLLERESALTTLISLLTHENSDISAKIVKIILDFVDKDDDDEVSRENDYTGKLVKKLLDLNLVDLLLSNLERLDTNVPAEDECIRDTLEVIETILEQDPIKLSEKANKIIKWMIGQLRLPGYSRTKFEIADILAILVSNSNENKVLLCKEGGIDVLLQIVARYRMISPVGNEQEFLAQIFNCLCICVLDCEEAKESFLVEEGVDLVGLILQAKNDAVKNSNIKISALQLLSYAVSTDKNEDPTVTKCCEQFVGIMGLKVIFPIFKNPKIMLNRKILKSEYRSFLSTVEEHTSSIIMAMLKYIQNEEFIQRILIKFAESKFEKFERALILHDKYFDVIRSLDENVIDSKTSLGVNNLRAINYIILLVVYLSQQYETYDPISGETFANYLRKTFNARPYLRHQIFTEVSKHIKDVENSPEEQKSLSYLLNEFDEIFNGMQD